MFFATHVAEENHRPFTGYVRNALLHEPADFRFVLRRSISNTFAYDTFDARVAIIASGIYVIYSG